jgi:hypothetical protein
VTSIADLKAEISAAIQEGEEAGQLLKQCFAKIESATNRTFQLTNSSKHPMAKEAEASFGASLPGVEATALPLFNGIQALKIWYEHI